jgi:hypothetical protein
MYIINEILPKIRIYQSIENEIIFKDDMYLLGCKKEKIKIRSIEGLKKVFKEFIMRELNNINKTEDHNKLEVINESNIFRNILSCYFQIEIEDIELIINQLAFDILYDKYIEDSPKITLNEYCTKNLRYGWDGLVNISEDMLTFEKSLDNEKLIERIKKEITTSNKYQNNNKLTDFLKSLIREFKFVENNGAVNLEDLATYADELIGAYKEATDATNKKMAAEIKYEAKIINNPALRADAIKLAINPELRIKRFTLLNRPGKKDITRRKCEWDYLYYNANPKLITYKQYRRKLKVNKSMGNYHNEHFIKDFQNYDSFIQTFMEKLGDSSKDYFDKSLEFYHLEIYKRLDFIYKLAVRMESGGFNEIDREHFLVKRFCPNVYYLSVNNDNSYIYEMDKHKYYRPLLFIEDLWQQRNQFDEKQYFDRWFKYHFIRARVYEVFHYHFEYVSDNYDDISTFIRNDYNILSYHESNKIWLNKEIVKKREQDIRIKNAIKINDALFGKSEKRLPYEM